MMALLQRIGLCIAVMTMVPLLTGCPTGPSLAVTPPNIALTSGQDSVIFRITNIGQGTLEWNVSANDSWLTVQQVDLDKGATSTLDGTTTTEVDVIEILVNRSLIPENTSVGSVSVSPVGGDIQEVRVAVDAAGSGPEFGVSTNSLDFGDNINTLSLNVLNTGGAPTTWSVKDLGDLPAWIDVSPINGLLPANTGVEAVEVTVDRTAFTDPIANPNENTFTLQSGSGDEEVITVSFNVGNFIVNPDALDFGTINSPQDADLLITNMLNSSYNLGYEALNDEVNVKGTVTWLTTDTAGDFLTGDGTTSVTVSVDPTGLPAGDYTGSIQIENLNTNYTVVIPVSMSVSSLVADPNVFDFPLGGGDTADNFNLINNGDNPLNYQINIPPTATDWLSIVPTSGLIGASATLYHEIFIDRSQILPGEYDATVTIDITDGTKAVLIPTIETLSITMAKVKPTELKAEPSDIDFGASRTEELLAIWNEGVGSIDYELDSSGFPAWLSIIEQDGNDVTGQTNFTGTVEGDTTHTYLLAIDRSLAGGATSLSHSFTVDQTNGALNQSVTVNVSADLPQIPEVLLEGDDVDTFGVPFISFDTDVESKNFFVTNIGDGDLFWEVDLETVPDWITSIEPAQDSLENGETSTATVVVDRSSLTYLGAQAEITILTNDPENPSLILTVEVLVEKTITIGTIPDSIAFGLNAVTSIVDIANTGDPETELNYRITSSKEWLSVFPDTGKSIGTPLPLKDWQAHTVTIDRSRLEGEGASGKLTVTAYRTENGNILPDENIEPVEIQVSVEASELTIETALPRLRIPSLVRSVLLMRNIGYQAIDIPESIYDTLAQQFLILENDVPVELTESNRFIKDISRARTTVLITLDYSASMQASANLVDDASITSAPDPLQALYERTITELIDSLPDNYRIGLAVFNDRVHTEGQAVRPILGDITEDVNTRDEIFIRDKDDLIARLAGIQVLDNGATQLYPALIDAASLMVEDDWRRSYFPFDDADVRALICVTDGRLTTPPGVITDVLDYLTLNRVRLLSVGWGDAVSADSLVQIASTTGGHFYSTRSASTGNVDEFGAPITIPVVEELEDWCVNDYIEGDPSSDKCDQSIARDLMSQFIFSYVSLNESANVTLEGIVTFDDPNDQEDPTDPTQNCIAEQGEITGSFIKSPLDYQGIAGDVRLGQISLHSSGIRNDDTATVLVRLEGTPRNIESLSFRIGNSVSGPGSIDSITQVSPINGGVISTWTQTGTDPIFTYTSPDGPLDYGEFGDLLVIELSGLTDPVGGFTFSFEVLDPLYDAGDPNSKYFTYPDNFTVYGEEYLAPAFPAATWATLPLSTPEAPYIIDLGTTDDFIDVFISNFGGSHAATGVELNWILLGGDNSNLWSVEPGDDDEGTLASTTEVDTFRLNIDRCQEVGEYETVFFFEYQLGTLGLTYQSAPITIRYEVDTPCP